MITLIKVVRLRLWNLGRNLVGETQTTSLLESASQSISGACKSPSSVTQAGGLHRVWMMPHKLRSPEQRCEAGPARYPGAHSAAAAIVLSGVARQDRDGVKSLPRNTIGAQRKEIREI